MFSASLYAGKNIVILGLGILISKPVFYEIADCFNPVNPSYLLALCKFSAFEAYWHFMDFISFFQYLCSYFRLKVKSCSFKLNLFDYFFPEDLVASFHVGYSCAVQQVSHKSEEHIADIMQLVHAF